ncbi:MAG TPA: hypothetical protein VGA70_10065 [Longimicrobiales bacterium]|jgi:4-amino-4-deoxy-L-arabinose transferase-like glycosyltransferase
MAHDAPGRARSWPDPFDLAALAALALLYAAIRFAPFGPNPFGDGDFHAEAQLLAAALQGSVPWSDVALTKAPGPVLFYLVPYVFIPSGSAEGVFWWAGSLWNLACVGTSILLLRRAAEALGGRRAGHVAVVLALGSPFAAYYCQAVAAEVPAFVGVCLALYGFARWRGAEDDTGVRRFRHEAMVWIGLSLFVLSRPNGVLLLGLSGLVGLWLWFRGAAPDRPLALMSLRTTVVVVTMLATFLGVASVLGGRGGELRQGGYLTYVVFQGRFQYRSEPWDWRYWANESRADSEDYQAWLRESGALITRARQSGVPLDDLQRRWILDDWLSNPGINARAAAIRSLTLHLYRVNSAEPEDFRVGALPGWLVFMAFHLAVNAVSLMLLAGTGAFLVLRRGALARYWVLWGPWLALLAFHALTYAEPRYLFPSQPGLVVMTALVLAPVLGGRSRGAGGSGALARAAETGSAEPA